MANMLHAIFLFGPSTSSPTVIAMGAKVFHILSPPSWVTTNHDLRRGTIVAAGEVLRGLHAYVRELIMFEPTSQNPLNPTDLPGVDHLTDRMHDGDVDGDFHGVRVHDIIDLLKLNGPLVAILITTELILPLVGNLWPRCG